MALLNYNLFANWTASWNGWRDATKGIPKPDDEPQHVTYEALPGYNGNLQYDIVKCATPFEVRICEKALMIIRRMYELGEKMYAELRSLQEEAQSRYEQAKHNYEQRKKERGRDAWFDRIPRWYMPLIIALGITELYINWQVFLRFSRHNHEAWTMALVLSFSLPVAGHFLGLFLRERPWNKTLLGWAVIATFVVGIAIWQISLLRARIIHQYGNANTGDVAIDWIFFLSLNLLVFLISVVAAYHAHEEDPRLLKYKQDFQTTERRLRSLQGQCEGFRSAYKNKAEAIVRRAMGLIAVYREANTRKRKDGMPPLFKTTHPYIKIPSFGQGEFAESQISPGIVVTHLSATATPSDSSSTDGKIAE